MSPTSISNSGGPTRLFECIEAELGELDEPDTLYMDWIWCRSNPRMQYTKTWPIESIQDKHAHFRECDHS